MRRATSIAMLIAIASLSASASAQASGLALSDFVRASLEASDEVALQQLALDRVNAARQERQGAYWPNLNATAQATKTGGQESSSEPGIATHEIGSSIQSKLTLTENLFNGFRDERRLKAAAIAIRQNEYLLQDRARAKIEEAVVQFFTLVMLDRDAASIKREIELNEQNFAAAKKRQAVGMARRTESINLESQIANNKIDLAASEAQLAQEMKKAERLIGGKNVDMPLIYRDLRFKAETIAKLMKAMNPEMRAELLNERTNAEAKAIEIDIARASYLPSLDASASYVLSDTSNFSQKNQYTIGLTLTVPVPLGGITSAQVREATISHAEAVRLSVQKRRDLELAKMQLSAELAGDIAQIERINVAKAAASANVEAMTKDHQDGLIAFSEVLSASTSYQQMLRKEEHAALEFEMACYKALIWSEEPPMALALIEGKQ